MKKWKVTFIDSNDETQIKIIDAIDIFIAITVSAIPYYQIISINMQR
jgi:hypothetical protein